MKVYILYVLSDYASAVYMSIDKTLCKEIMKEYRKNVTHPM